MHVTTIEVDLPKSVFQIHGVDDTGKAVLKKRVSRTGFVPFMAKLPPCLVGMEICGGQPLESNVGGMGTYRQADESAICEAVCQNEQE